MLSLPAAAAMLAVWWCAGLCGELPLPLPLLPPALLRVCSGERCVPGAGVLCGCNCRGSIDGSIACCCVFTLLWRDIAGEEPIREEAESGPPFGNPGSAHESMERWLDGMERWLAALTQESTPSNPRDLPRLTPPAEPCL